MPRSELFTKLTRCSICGLGSQSRSICASDLVDRERAVEQRTDRALDVASFRRVEARALEPDAIHRARHGPVALRDRERRDVLVCERAGREERVRADTRELREAGETAHERVVLDRHVARELRRVHDHDVLRDLAVVADVRVRHHEVVVAKPRDASALLRAEVDAHELADPVVVADLERGVRAGLVARSCGGPPSTAPCWMWLCAPIFTRP